jgi:2-oxoglutarate dehydrogenase E2 component (dihydrolipoamide succinyltransferase)
VKRLLGALALALLGVVPLLGAYSMTPPVAIVYPLSGGSGADPEAGATIAVLLAQGLAQRGITVRPAPPGTKRSEYLIAAQKAGADYYVTGFLSALGDEVSMVVQVVSTASGSIVSSTTSVVKTYTEAAGQSDAIAQAILHHAGRALASLDEPQAVASETPQPSRSDKGNEANLTGLGALFHRKPKATPAPAIASAAASSAASSAALAPAVPAPRAAPTPIPPAPPAPPLPANVAYTGPRYLVLQVGGDAEQSLGERAARDIAAAASRNGTTAESLPVKAIDAVAHASDFCRANAGTRGFYAATLSLQRNDAGAATGAQVDIVMYDCNGNAVERRRGTAAAGGRGGIDGAIDRAVTSAFSVPSRG